LLFFRRSNCVSNHRGTMATPCALDDLTTAKKAGKSELACSGYNCMHKCN